MAALYLYAITDQTASPLPALSGLEDAPLYQLACQDLAGVMSAVTTTQVQATESNLWQHEAIVEALMADRAVLPVRFGTVFANEAAAQAELRAHQTDLLASLNRVCGRVELGLRILINPTKGGGLSHDERTSPVAPRLEPATKDQPETAALEQSAPASRGRAYLMTRLAEEQRARVERQQAGAQVAEIHVPLARLAVNSVQQMLVTPRLLLTAAYLVERDQVEVFRQAVAALSDAHPDLSLLCTGPWPPYNFVDLRAPVEPGD
jgi:hypothetical protein